MGRLSWSSRFLSVTTFLLLGSLGAARAESCAEMLDSVVDWASAPRHYVAATMVTIRASVDSWSEPLASYATMQLRYRGPRRICFPGPDCRFAPAYVSGDGDQLFSDRDLCLPSTEPVQPFSAKSPDRLRLSADATGVVWFTLLSWNNAQLMLRNPRCENGTLSAFTGGPPSMLVQVIFESRIVQPQG